MVSHKETHIEKGKQKIALKEQIKNLEENSKIVRKGKRLSGIKQLRKDNNSSKDRQ